MPKNTALVNAALESNDITAVKAVLFDLARQQGMSSVADAAGLNRENLYRLFQSDGGMHLDTFLKLTGALGMKLQIVRIAGG
jgi:probable addiction module antidote protein